MNNVLNFNYGYGHRYSRTRTLASDKEHYNTLLISHSGLSKYIPFYAGFCNKLLSNKDKNKNCLVYELYSYKADRFGYPGRIRYADLMGQLKQGNALNVHLKTFRGHQENVLYQVTKGCVLYCHYRGHYRGFSEDSVIKPLIMLCFDKDKYFEMDLDRDPKPEDFILLISNSINNLEHKALYAQLRKHYINPLRELGVDFLYADDITKYCFTGLAKMKFSSFQEKQEYLSSLNNEILDEAN